MFYMVDVPRSSATSRYTSTTKAREWVSLWLNCFRFCYLPYFILSVLSFPSMKGGRANVLGGTQRR